MKWRYGGVRHGTSAGKRRDTAFGVLALLHQENRPTLLGHAEPTLRVPFMEFVLMRSQVATDQDDSPDG